MLQNIFRLRSAAHTGAAFIRRHYGTRIPQIQSSQFDKEVLQSKIPVLVDFYAVWCGPCKVLSPKLEELADLKEGQYRIVKIDGEENTELASKLKISAYPTVVLFKDGKEIDRFIGVRDLKNILSFLDKHTPTNKT